MRFVCFWKAEFFYFLNISAVCNNKSIADVPVLREQFFVLANSLLFWIYEKQTAE
jgi:hypothetical protein